MCRFGLVNRTRIGGRGIGKITCDESQAAPQRATVASRVYARPTTPPARGGDGRLGNDRRSLRTAVFARRGALRRAGSDLAAWVAGDSGATRGQRRPSAAV